MIFFFLFSEEEQNDEATVHLCFSPCVSSVEQEQDSHLDGEVLSLDLV